MEVKQIVILVFVLLVVIYLIIYSFSKSSQLTKMSEGKLLQIITAKDFRGFFGTIHSKNVLY